eukprot:Protomagalhaensia_sp_Gyna_25__471@NODE_1223_length_2049_cov_4_586567_g975_i0_p4_GENE_NODE_1223_length_2049_cov_4_586567_g975_i0NODE_1223_length_2049_cov_4_586567_g975_i0_p4_ORF_typecomplete_len116_score0_89_NODE_1223_length_2049_cov_4_586567_g975_i06681015
MPRAGNRTLVHSPPSPCSCSALSMAPLVRRCACRPCQRRLAGLRLWASGLNAPCCFGLGICRQWTGWLGFIPVVDRYELLGLCRSHPDFALGWFPPGFWLVCGFLCLLPHKRPDC